MYSALLIIADMAGYTRDAPGTELSFMENRQEQIVRAESERGQVELDRLDLRSTPLEDFKKSRDELQNWDELNIFTGKRSLAEHIRSDHKNPELAKAFDEMGKLLIRDGDPT